MTGDKLLLIYAEDVIKEYNAKGMKPVIVSEVKCSQVLYDTINENGGVAVMCKTGHGYIKSKMRETGAVLAGEMSGHTFFKDHYYGFDDAVYAGCRIIQIVAGKKRENPNFKITDMLEPFKSMYSSSEVRLPCPNSLKAQTLEEFQKEIAENPDFFGTNIKDIFKIKMRDKSNPEFKDIPLKNFFEKKTSGDYTKSSIHGVKGETYDAVLIYVKSKTGKTLTPKFLMEGDLEDELMRIAYVAMTRPRRLLMIAMPENKKLKEYKRFPVDKWDYEYV